MAQVTHSVAKRRPQNPLDVRFELRLDQDTADRLQAQAARLGLSMGAYMRSAVIRQLEADEAAEDRPTTTGREPGGSS